MLYGSISTSKQKQTNMFDLAVCVTMWHIKHTDTGFICHIEQVSFEQRLNYFTISPSAPSSGQTFTLCSPLVLLVTNVTYVNSYLKASLKEMKVFDTLCLALYRNWLKIFLVYLFVSCLVYGSNVLHLYFLI